MVELLLEPVCRSFCPLFFQLVHQVVLWLKAGPVLEEFHSFAVCMHCFDGQITVASHSAPVLKDHLRLPVLISLAKDLISWLSRMC